MRYVSKKSSLRVLAEKKLMHSLSYNDNGVGNKTEGRPELGRGGCTDLRVGFEFGILVSLC
ncbi:MAG: hypothetical protein JMM76_02575 [Candidatus Xiphinematobacter sp.]|nr:MAG: hypothetical protein JMM76_02575 [Candidatus Xiphinematobacter sp.]QQY11098.1 MAG: hypothetical protein JMM77_02620 [Candidatus Xiphinematobacter sp.]